MKSVYKYVLVSVLITILAITAFGFYSLEKYHDAEVNNENVRLEMCIRTFWQLLSFYGDDFRVVDGRLQVGSYVANGNFELPDRIQEIFGGYATIFMGDERVSTNVLNADGKRALGTRLEGPAYEALFKQGRSYRGTAPILGASYLTAYDPIADKTGKVIGALFVGVKESDFIDRLHVMKKQLTVTLITTVLVLTSALILMGFFMKRVEDEKDQQVRFLQTLIDTIPNPVFHKDSECRYTGCNKAFEKVFGYCGAELIGKTPHELWPDDLADRYRQQDLELLANPGTQSYETKIMEADGVLHDVIFNKATFEGKGGAVAGVVGVVLDITERKAAADATKSAYQQLLDIVDFLPDATFVVDKDKRVIAWNRAIEQMTGIAKCDIMGKGDYAYAVPFYGERRPILIDLIDEDVDVIRSKYSYITIEGRTLFAETYIPKFRNGTACFLWGTATPLFDRQGAQIGAIESIRDITAYKLVEEEKSRLLSQLNYANLMETVMNRLGHDLKTPLTPLFVMLPLIRKRLDDPALIKKIDLCIKCAANINMLADKTRILASLSAQVHPHELEGVSLAAVVEKALAGSAHALSQKQISCRVNVDPSIAVRCVPAQLHELFLNLIANSVQFSGAESVITISAERSREALTISVRDEGVGIDPAHLEHVFDEFFKTDESRHELEASGLGLSICKRIVQNHHGRIWAESPGIGTGTTIRISLNEQSIDCIQ